MATTSLMAHCGARIVERAELDKIDPPSATPTWAPVKHSVLLDTVGRAMELALFHVRNVKIAVARDNHRLFATLDTSTGLNGGEITLAVAVVNSTDKSLPMKFIAGNRVFCCDNLALRSDLMAPVRRKHSRFGLERFTEALALAVTGLDHFKTAESARIKRFKALEISDTQRDAVLLRSYERGIISHRLLPRVIEESRKPSFDYGCPVNTAWVLEQAFTTVLTDTVVKSNPQRFCALSLSIQELLSQSFGAPTFRSTTPREAHEAETETDVSQARPLQADSAQNATASQEEEEMTRRKGRKKKRRANSGSFHKGPDPRRHAFTRAECKLRWAHCMLGYGRCSDPKVCAWVFRRVRSFYRKEASNGQEANGDGGTAARESGSEAGRAAGPEREVPF